MNKKIIIFYIIISTITTLFIYKDYGISWDEGMQRRTAQINFDYIFNGDKELDTWIDRDYGVAFELPLYTLEKVFKWEKTGGDEQYVYINRHLVTHLFYVLGGVFLFLLVSQLFESKLYGILALFLYTFQPRIFAHSFVNTKDIPLMVLFIICFYVFFKFIKKRTVLNAIILGVVTAVLINIRILGIIFPVMAIGYIFLFDFIDKGKSSFKNSIKHVIIFLLTTGIVVYCIWPTLWKNPIVNFLQFFENMSHFRHDTLELVFGEFVRAREDKTYFFKWFFTTNPLGYLLIGCSGILLLLFTLLKNGFKNLKDEKIRFILFLVAFFVTPLTIIIFKKSVLYNGWRQLFFLYPSFIIMAIYFFDYFKKFKVHKFLLLVFFGYSISLFFHVKDLHPQEAVYFNELVPKSKDYIIKNYEFDYWGMSYKMALEELLVKDTTDTIKFATSEYVGAMNVKILNPIDRKRLVYVKEIENADYFISNFYADNLKFKNKTVVFEKQIYNSLVITIFKLK